MDDFDYKNYLKNNPLLKENLTESNKEKFFNSIKDLNNYIKDYDEVDYDINLNKINRALDIYSSLDKQITPKVVNYFLMLSDEEDNGNVDIEEIPDNILRVWDHINGKKDPQTISKDGIKYKTYDVYNQKKGKAGWIDEDEYVGLAKIGKIINLDGKKWEITNIESKPYTGANDRITVKEI